jgi:hypothetical protein
MIGVRWFLIALIWVCITLPSFSQATIEGRVLNSKHEKLPFNTIVLKSRSDSLILAYTISNAEGYYSLTLKSALDSVILSVSHMGYETFELVIPVLSQKIDAVLNESSLQLKEIIIRPDTGIRQSGDTLSYSVDKFKMNNDQVIADLLRRLPGIQVEPNGAILYMGRPIEKYYIDGLDLLEGRYGLANNNLSIGAVDQVQVLENHQTIRVLDSLMKSDQTSINIKLKNGVTTTGEARMAAGSPFMLYDVNATPMLFTKNHQMLLSYQGNNSGNDLTGQLEVLGIQDVMAMREGHFTKDDWLSIPEVRPNDMNSVRWLDNQTHMFTPNYLQKLKGDYQLKLNLSYLSNIQRQYGEVNTGFFTQTDTIRITEGTRNRLSTNELKTAFILEKNTRKKYLKNKVEFTRQWETHLGEISGTNEVSQHLTLPNTSVMNRFSTFLPVKSKLLSYNSTFAYNQSSNILNVSPGVFPDMLNGGLPYDSTVQQLKRQNLFLNNSIGFTQKIKLLTIGLRSGVLLQSESMESGLDVNNEGIISNFSVNTLTLNQYSVYSEATTQIQKNQWTINGTGKFRYLSFNTDGNGQGSLGTPTFFVVEPRVTLIKQMGSKFRTALSYSIHNNFGSLNRLYQDFILTNYRNIVRNDPVFPKTITKSPSVMFSYKDIAKGLFANLSYSYSLSTYNLLQELSINEFGGRTLNQLERTNNGQTEFLKIIASKYLDDLGLTLTFNYDLTSNTINQLVASNISQFKVQNATMGPKISYRISPGFLFRYDLNFNRMRNFSEGNIRGELSSTSHISILSYNLKSHLFSTRFEYYTGTFGPSTASSSFLDAKYSYVPKGKFGLDFSITNLLNKTEFISLASDPYSFTVRRYSLRPRQFLIGARMRF